MISLKDIVPSAANSVNTKFILLEKGKIIVSEKCVEVNGRKETRQTKGCLSLVADETASVHFLLHDTECEAVDPGDIICLSKGIFSYHGKKLVLRSGRKGRAEKVGEFTMLFVETPNMSEIEWGPDPNNPKTLVQKSVISTHSRIFPQSS